VFDAGGGYMTLTIVNTTSAALLVAEVMNGCAHARAVLHAADRLLRKIERHPRVRALPCLLCDDNVMWRSEPPGAIGVLAAFGATPVRVAVSMAICLSCAMDRSDRELGLAAVAKLRDGMLPDLRVLPPMTAAGHA
jgi:hypothetical protein